MTAFPAATNFFKCLEGIWLLVFPHAGDFLPNRQTLLRRKEYMGFYSMTLIVLMNSVHASIIEYH